MGCVVRTQQLRPDKPEKDWRALEDMDRKGEGIWACGRGAEGRELKEVPGNYGEARIHYHSLLAEIGGIVERHREFLQFYQARVYPAYVLAYRRILE